MTEIVPAILTNDISDFRKQYAELFALSHYFTKLHIDFIDGKFIENKTVQPKDLGFLKSSPLNLMAHLMCLEPQQYFFDLKNLGFQSVTFHVEAFKRNTEIEETIQAARDLNLRVGLALNPETPLSFVERFLPKVNMIQLMSIHPGAQGREFMPATIEKIRELRSLSKNVIISVDGGIKVGIARECARAGANILVAGAAILKSEDEEMAIEALQADIEIK